jgi:hypothetical protein
MPGQHDGVAERNPDLGDEADHGFQRQFATDGEDCKHATDARQ